MGTQGFNLNQITAMLLIDKMSPRYPRIDPVKTVRLADTLQTCPCLRIAKFRIRIETSEKRSEDRVAYRCEEHKTEVIVP